MMLRLRPRAYLFVMISFLGSLDTFASAACISQFHNKSNYQWSISGFDGVQSTIMVAPNSTANIPWGTPTNILISGAIKNRPYTRRFQTQAADNCFMILHQGNTGNIFLNRPAAGDVVTCRGNC
jgi:hypothetical protein